MKIKQLAQLVVFISVLLFSCRKTNDEFNTNASIKKLAVDFLNQKIGKGEGIAAGILKGIKDNAEFEKAWLNPYEDGKQIVTIPIGKGYQFKNNKDKNPDNYLVLFKRADGKVTSGYVWQALPGSIVTKNTLANIYNHIEEDLEGEYVLLDLKDNFQFKQKYVNSKMQELWMREARPSANAVNSSGTLSCVDYSVVRTTYDMTTGEIWTQEVLYTFQVCTCTPSNVAQSTIIGPGECDPFIGGGGGSAPEPPYVVQKVVEKVVATSAIPGNYSVKSVEELKGLKGITPTMDRPWDGEFTGITHLNHPYTCGSIQHSSGAWVPRISSLSSVGVSAWVNIHSADRYIGAQINFSDGGPATAFSKQHFWIFQTEFPN